MEICNILSELWGRYEQEGIWTEKLRLLGGFGSSQAEKTIRDTLECRTFRQLLKVLFNKFGKGG